MTEQKKSKTGNLYEQCGQNKLFTKRTGYTTKHCMQYYAQLFQNIIKLLRPINAAQIEYDSKSAIFRAVLHATVSTVVTRCNYARNAESCG